MDKIQLKRMDNLFDLDMAFDYQDSFIGKEKYNADFNVAIVEIITNTDDQWAEMIGKMSKELTRRQLNEQK